MRTRAAISRARPVCQPGFSANFRSTRSMSAGSSPRRSAASITTVSSVFGPSVDQLFTVVSEFHPSDATDRSSSSSRAYSYTPSTASSRLLLVRANRSGRASGWRSQIDLKAETAGSPSPFKPRDRRFVRA